ncbi:transforming acidic coiled-coil-containing protein 3 isoform X2 [Neocloeon triangulifer]|uniref:transforming acidic coiled-coil-containing protein 3 isoform X2 n=1 Tax=Neocloeon triangulifer TaxID=2078957 RepID=UPI00286F454B|nr:transforming acidic coiled-coil-containing protein 3 isoform X2 [Neocloeon triangulifer]
MDFLSKLFKTPNKNGNICERDQSLAIEAVTAKTPNGDSVNSIPPQLITLPPSEEKQSPEEEQSQALTDTNSASFASLNTLSVSEANFNTAGGDQSRPKSTDTDSLDYESADEAVSLKNETPIEEDGDAHNKSLGLDALANKLSNLYLNSPNPHKKPPAFHNEDQSNHPVHSQLDESDSDISFTASFVEVVKLEESSEGAEKPGLSCIVEVESPIEEETLIVEEVSEPEDQPQSKEQSNAELQPPKPKEQPETSESELQLPKLEEQQDETKVEEVQESPRVIEEAPQEAAAREDPVEESHCGFEQEVQPCEVPLPESEPSSAEQSPKEKESPAEQPEVVDSQPVVKFDSQKNEVKSLAELAKACTSNSQEETATEITLVVTPIAEQETPIEVTVEENSETVISEGATDSKLEIVTSLAAANETCNEEPEESHIPENVPVVDPTESKEETVTIKTAVVEPILAVAAVNQEDPKEPVIEEKCITETKEFLIESKEDKPVLELESQEPIVEVSFEEPTPIFLEAPSTELSQVEVEVEQFKALEIRSSIEQHIPKEETPKEPEGEKEVDPEPEKEVSEEKPVTERKIAPATLFIQQSRGVTNPHKDTLFTSTGSLSELLDLCEKQQRNLEDEVDTQVFEESNELEQLLAADADLVCQELNASLDAVHAEMSDNEVPVTPPRRSRSPRKPSPGRNNIDQDVFKIPTRIGNSPSRGTEINTASMTSSSESAVMSSRMSMTKSTDSASPKSMRSMDSGIAGAEMNHSEAGPDIAPHEEQFVSGTEELFKDPSAFDFLSKFGGSDSSASRLERESLYVKFDPLVGNRDRRVFLSPCIEASPRSEDNVEATPEAPGKRALRSETPLTSRHAVGPLVQIATPVNETETPAAKSEPVSQSNSKDAETEALQQMVVLHKKESDELKKLMTSQIQDYEEKLSALQAKLKQKTEAEEQMSLVMKEYEDTISRILAEKEKAMEKAQEDRQKLTEELVIIQSDLSAAEVAFSDLHRKYERAKSAIEVFKSNENTLKQSNLQFQEQIKQAEKRYLVLKSHAEDKLEEAAKENEALVKTSELEMSALKAQNAQLKARNTTLVETLAMRERENQELMTICDDLVQKLGTQSH